MVATCHPPAVAPDDIQLATNTTIDDIQLVSSATKCEVDIHICIYIIYVYVCIYIYACVPYVTLTTPAIVYTTHTQTHTHTSARTHTHPHSLWLPLSHSQTHMLTWQHTRKHTHSHTNAYLSLPKLTRNQVCCISMPDIACHCLCPTHNHTHTHSLSLSLSHSLSLTRTHTHARAHTHMHAHTPTHSTADLKHNQMYDISMLLLQHRPSFHTREQPAVPRRSVLVVYWHLFMYVCTHACMYIFGSFHTWARGISMLPRHRLSLHMHECPAGPRLFVHVVYMYTWMATCTHVWMYVFTYVYIYTCAVTVVYM